MAIENELLLDSKQWYDYAMEKIGKIFIGDEEGNIHSEERRIKEAAKPESKFIVDETGVAQEKKSQTKKVDEVTERIAALREKLEKKSEKL